LNRRNDQEAQQLLPWHSNHTLGEKESRQVQEWINSSDDAQREWEITNRLAVLVKQQPVGGPHPGILQALQLKVSRQQPARQSWLSGSQFWAAGMGLTLIVLTILWAAVQPGIALRWTVSGDLPDTFRIYRARVGSSSYELIREIGSRPDVAEYQFVDSRLIPTYGYIYRVEGVGQSGRIALSQSVVAPPMAALLEQVAVLLASLVVSFTLLSIIEFLPGYFAMQRRLAT
jgi:hypothetical protein